MVELSLDGVTKRYDDAQGSETAVRDFSLTVEDELLVLLGPSGCGKTTTLRMIAGLESVTSGQIRIDGRDVTGLAPSERSIAMVFQDYGLYRTMSVRENIAYGLKHSTSLSSTERADRVEEIAEMFGIGELLDRPVTDLSGGQKQRVSLGRAMVREPDVFLLDEPLASLDAKLRSEMRTELQQLQSELDITTVYVTHDQKEAMTMADRLAVLDNGILQQAGPPTTVYEDPANEFVASFLGNPAMNQLDGQIKSTAERGQVVVHTTDAGQLELAPVPPGAPVTDGQRVRIGFRPEDIVIGPQVSETDGFLADVVVTEYQGDDSFIHLDIDGTALTVVAPPHIRPATGETVRCQVGATDLYLFDPETGDALLTAAMPAQERSPEP